MSDFQVQHQWRMNFVNDEENDLLADSKYFEGRRLISDCYWMYLGSWY
jgi:hypothetical protein